MISRRPAGAAPETSPEQRSRFVRERLRLGTAPGFPEIRLYLAHPGSGLWRLAELAGGGGNAASPYWAYVWAGGAVLARHVLTCPETVAGKRVLDLGAGSGLVGIAAALAGATRVRAAERDPFGIAAIDLNAAANGVALETLAGDATGGAVPAVDLILAGDVFYDRAIARRMAPFLTRCAAAGVAVLVGDPGRRDLPVDLLTPVADYPAADFGDPPGAARPPSTVFAWQGVRR